MAESPARIAWLTAHREELRAYHKAWRDQNKARIKGYEDARKVRDPERFAMLCAKNDRASRERNPERTKAKSKKHGRLYRARHPERKRELWKRWKKENPEKRRELERRYYEKNKEQMAERFVVLNERRRARVKNATGNGVTRAQWRALQGEYGGRCAYCARLTKLTMDHVDPLSKGGAHDLSNIVPACKSCNSGKGPKTLLQWLVAQRAAA